LPKIRRDLKSKGQVRKIGFRILSDKIGRRATITASAHCIHLDIFLFRVATAAELSVFRSLRRVSFLAPPTRTLSLVLLDMNRQVDLSPTLSTLLRTGTAVAHERVERSQGAGWLARGELDRDEYVRFLMMLWHVYDNLERALEEHASNPILSFTYNPTLLSRSASLSADISHLLQINQSAWLSHPIHVALMNSPPPALSQYLMRIESIRNSQDPSPLLAHAYVRYLGDLSGGQIIRNKITKAYDLHDGLGVAFYEFKSLGGSGLATVGDMKKIKEWYRQNMDLAVGDNATVKAALLEEAQIAFELNGGLFAALQEPSSPKSVDPALPPLGEPTTPVSDDFEPSSEKDLAKVVYDGAGSGEKTYQLSSVLAVIAAMSLAHFILVVGGFTGDRGYAKLEAVRNWFR